MTFAEVIAQLLGWLGEFVGWLFDWVPRYVVIDFNEAGVKYPRGKQPIKLDPGVHWYCKNLSRVVQHYTCRFVNNIKPVCVETKDEVPVMVGMVITAHVVDVLKLEVENVNADNNMDEVAQGALRDVIMEHTWAELCKAANDGSRFGNVLAARVGKSMQRFGVEVESARPNDQVRLDLRRGAIRIFR